MVLSGHLFVCVCVCVFGFVQYVFFFFFLRSKTLFARLVYIKPDILYWFYWIFYLFIFFVTIRRETKPSFVGEFRESNPNISSN